MEIYVQQDKVSEFADMLKRTSGLDVNLCYQCKKCSSGCPISYAMDYPPAQLMHLIRLGLKDLVFKSNTIWLCASCETCTTRCPQEVDIAKTMDALRIMAFNAGIKPPVADMAAFYRTGRTNIRFFGRMYELGLIGMLKLSTRQFTRDLDLGMKMLKKGKLKLLPSFKGSSSTRKIFAKVKESSRV